MLLEGLFLQKGLEIRPPSAHTILVYLKHWTNKTLFAHTLILILEEDEGFPIHSIWDVIFKQSSVKESFCPICTPGANKDSKKSNGPLYALLLEI